ncbi:hypothetical protein HDU97_009765, partial [Phlyctochytrium planicorne]
MWRPQHRIDGLADLKTLAELQNYMTETRRKHLISGKPTEALFVSSGSNQARAGGQKRGDSNAHSSNKKLKATDVPSEPNEELRKKSKPNTVGLTGYTYLQLKAMSKDRRMNLTKAAKLTCNKCNTVGHIGYDCKDQQSTSVAPTQTNYKAMLVGVPKNEIVEFLAEQNGSHFAANVTINEPTAQQNDKQVVLASTNTPAATLTDPTSKFRFPHFVGMVFRHARLHPLADDGVQQWAWDTGLTDDALTPNLQDLTNPTPFRSQIDGAFAGAMSTHIGTINGYTNMGLPLSFVALCVPGIRARLVSRTVLAAQDIYLNDG